MISSRSPCVTNYTVNIVTDFFANAYACFSTMLLHSGTSINYKTKEVALLSSTLL